MRFKPILSACLAAALLIPCALPATADDDPTAPEAAETASEETVLPEFTDIEGHWAHEAIVRFREAGAITDERGHDARGDGDPAPARHALPNRIG